MSHLENLLDEQHESILCWAGWVGKRFAVNFRILDAVLGKIGPELKFHILPTKSIARWLQKCVPRLLTRRIPEIAAIT